jgi:hypothetical protein
MLLSRLDSLPLAHGYAGLGSPFALPAQPTGLRQPRLLHLSRAGCELLDLDPESVDPERAAAWFAGGEALPGSRPVALAYSGHQFGIWAGQLGDGRALLLGEVTNRRGETWDVQLKGSGPTAYSRMGDGRAVLRSTLREYVAGEALAGLGIPTTRALALCTSAEPVEREETETGAVLVRLARCHLRFGTFEHFHAAGRPDLLRVLFGYVLGRWYGHLSGRSRRGLAFLEEVSVRSARLLAQWMAVGFCHGVMNTDNLSILGETIDYGPFGFLDDFAWGHVSNSSDHEGRYAFARQPEVAAWNLARLAEATACLVPERRPEELGERVVGLFGETFEREYRSRMARKLGLEEAAPGFDGLLQETLRLLSEAAADHTLFWRRLSEAPLQEAAPATLQDLFPKGEALQAWWSRYRELRAARAAGGSWASSRRSMLATNPKFVARNHLLQGVIALAGAPALQRARLDDLLRVLARPFNEHSGLEALAQPPVGAVIRPD